MTGHHTFYNWLKMQQFSYKEIDFKISSVKWRPFCPGLNVFRKQIWLLAIWWKNGVRFIVLSKKKLRQERWIFKCNLICYIEINCVTFIPFHQLFLTFCLIFYHWWLPLWLYNRYKILHIPRAKFCSDHVVRFEVRALQGFHQIWIAMEKLLAKWDLT